MVFITVKRDTLHSFIWTKAMPLDELMHNDEVVEVQADGPELALILEEGTNLVHTHARTQRWFGDHAQFIAHNIITQYANDHELVIRNS